MQGRKGPGAAREEGEQEDAILVSFLIEKQLEAARKHSREEEAMEAHLIKAARDPGGGKERGTKDTLYCGGLRWR